MKIEKAFSKSLFNIAINNSVLDEIYFQVSNIQKSKLFTNGIIKVMENPFLDKSFRINSLKEIFKNEISNLLLEFMILLVEKNSFYFINKILDLFIEAYENHKKIIKVKIIVPFKIDGLVLEKIKNKAKDISKKNDSYSLRYCIIENPELIGGYIIAFGSYIYDASLYSALESLNKSFAILNLN